MLQGGRAASDEADFTSTGIIFLWRELSRCASVRTPVHLVRAQVHELRVGRQALPFASRPAAHA